jgi:hypothetical protein
MAQKPLRSFSKTKSKKRNAFPPVAASKKAGGEQVTKIKGENMNTKKKTRTANILIRVTPAEKKAIQAAAKRAGMTVTEYLTCSLPT